MAFKRYNKRRFGHKKYGGKHYGRKHFSSYRRTIAKPEMKYLDIISPINGAITTPAWTGTEILNNIAQGTNAGQRVGAKILVRGIMFRGNLEGGQLPGGATDDPYDRIRVVCYTVDSAFAIANLAAVILDAPINKEEVDGVKKKLFDHTFVLKAPFIQGAGFGLAMKQVKFFKKVMIPITYTRAGNLAQTDITLAAKSDSAIVPNPAFLVNFVRVYYTDA